MEVKPENVPATLRSLPQWIVWRHETRNGEPTKLPYQITGEMAKSNDPSTWVTFDEAVRCYRASGRYSGIGFVFADGGGICGIDLDGCRDPESGEWSEWARRIIKEFATYTEMSPSQTGAKLFVIGKAPFTSGRNRRIDDAPVVCEKEPGIEVYDKLRYFAVTGCRLAGMPAEPRECQELIDRYCAEWFPAASAPPVPRQDYDSDAKVAERARQYVAKMPVAVSGQGGHNAAFKVACVLVLGFGLSPSDAYAIFAEWNQGCSPPWSEKELQHKLDSAEKQGGPRNWLRNVPEQRWHTVRLPELEVPPEPPLSTTLEAAAADYLRSVKDGSRPLISLGLGDVDYALGGGVEQSEMVIIAARPSHGKTAIGLQAAYEAASEKLPVLIISEEMSRLALGKRVLQFASSVPEEKWKVESGAVEQDVEMHFFDKAPIYVVESCVTVERAMEAMRQHVREHGVRLVLVDYGQLLQSKGRSKYEQTSATSVALRQVTNELNVTTIVLCQLNRAVEQRDKFIPRMGDLRDSGQLEQDADVILFLLWPHRLDSNHDPYEYFVFCAKNRNRPILQPTIKCRFMPSRQMLRAEEPENHYEKVRDF